MPPAQVLGKVLLFFAVITILTAVLVWGINYFTAFLAKIFVAKAEATHIEGEAYAAKTEEKIYKKTADKIKGMK
jgi:hypothetical protein